MDPRGRPNSAINSREARFLDEKLNKVSSLEQKLQRHRHLGNAHKAVVKELYSSNSKTNLLAAETVSSKEATCTKTPASAKAGNSTRIAASTKTAARAKTAGSTKTAARPKTVAGTKTAVSAKTVVSAQATSSTRTAANLESATKTEATTITKAPSDTNAPWEYCTLPAITVDTPKVSFDKRRPSLSCGDLNDFSTEEDEENLRRFRGRRCSSAKSESDLLYENWETNLKTGENLTVNPCYFNKLPGNDSRRASFNSDGGGSARDLLRRSSDVINSLKHALTPENRRESLAQSSLYAMTKAEKDLLRHCVRAQRRKSLSMNDLGPYSMITCRYLRIPGHYLPDN